MFAVSTVITFSVQFQATTFPLYVQSLGGNLATAGLMTSIYMGTSALSKPTVGKMLAKYPRKPLLIGAGLLFSLFMLSFGFVEAILALMILRTLNAPFYSVYHTAATTITTDILPKDHLIEGLGYYNFAQTLSYALGPGIALFLINDFSYRTLFTVSALFGLASVMIGSTVKYQDPIVLKKKEAQSVSNTENLAARKEAPAESAQLTFQKEFIPPSVMLFLIMLGCGGIVTFFPTWARSASIGNVGAFFTVQAIALAISRIFVGKVTKLIGVSKTIIISLVFVCICLFGISWCTSIVPLLFLAILYGLGFGSIVPTLHSIAIVQSNLHTRGMANSMISMGTDAGICMSSLMLGILADLFGIGKLFLIASLFPVLALITYLVLLRPKVRELEL